MTSDIINLTTDTLINDKIILNRVIVGGHEWLSMGVHNGKDIWITVQEGNKQAFVAIYDYDHPKNMWIVTRRRWVTTTKRTKNNEKVLSLRITRLRRYKYKTLLEAQQSITLLVHH